MNRTPRKSGTRGTAGRKERKLTPPRTRPSVEEVLERGQQAVGLLMDPVFNLAWSSLRTSLLERIATSRPEQQGLRDLLYNQLSLMAGLLEELDGYRLEAQQASAEMQYRVEAARQNAEADHGFGLSPS
jgi:hypothetical protein